MLLCQLSYTVKSQRKTRNASSMGLWVPSAVSSWQKRAGVRIIWSRPTQITLIKVLCSTWCRRGRRTWACSIRSCWWWNRPRPLSSPGDSLSGSPREIQSEADRSAPCGRGGWTRSTRFLSSQYPVVSLSEEFHFCFPCRMFPPTEQSSDWSRRWDRTVKSFSTLNWKIKSSSRWVSNCYRSSHLSSHSTVYSQVTGIHRHIFGVSQRMTIFYYINLCGDRFLPNYIKTDRDWKYWFDRGS